MQIKGVGSLYIYIYTYPPELTLEKEFKLFLCI